MGCTAELAADIWERRQEILESGIGPEDMPDSLDLELAELEYSLGCPFVDFFDRGKREQQQAEEAQAWNQWFTTLNSGDGGVWSELSDRMQALYDAEECYFYDLCRVSCLQESCVEVRGGTSSEDRAGETTTSNT